MAYIGTAGWNIPKQHAQRFAPHGSHLERYAGTFNAVEINSSFYRHHRRETYERWARTVPGGFRFSVKVPRQITHESRLADCEPVLDRFLGEVGGLGNKLGVLLVQLPGSFYFDTAVADAFLARLSRHGTARIACEPRHPSWFEPGVDALLREHGVARVAADPERATTAGAPGGALDLVYYRLHGSPRTYYSSYDDAWLERLHHRMTWWLTRARSVWCIFDNTAAFAATENALTLQQALALTPREA